MSYLHEPLVPSTAELLADLTPAEREQIRGKVEQIIQDSSTGGWAELREGLEDQRLRLAEIYNKRGVFS